MGNRAPLVSIIVPNYNHARFLTERFESILAQTYHNFELIILDDCSTDNSCEVIERYRENPHVSQIVYNEKNLLKRRDDNMVITVSEYSKRALMYNFDIPETKIHVKYSPERIFVGGAEFSENERLRSLITEGKKYYLLVSADRVAKNAKKALAAFQKYVKISPNSYIVTIGYKRELYENHIDLPILSDCDLLQAYVNCYALVYPSYFEGFGYPPVEAMKCGKPVLSSNVCSMPEVLGDAPIYFSPIYESAIFGAFCQLTDDNYQYYSEKSKMQYLKVCEKQEKDLEELVNIIMS